MEIQLTQGKVALVDDEDFEALNVYKWQASKHKNRFYATRNVRVGTKRMKVTMHGVIIGGKGIDHIDHNGLNNQRSNLRLCTNSENIMNSPKWAKSSSIYKGVSFFKPTVKWTAQIVINRKKIHLGYFTSEIEAAKAYNNKAIELFGEFANLNTFESRVKYFHL